MTSSGSGGCFWLILDDVCCFLGELPKSDMPNALLVALWLLRVFACGNPLCLADPCASAGALASF